jgi:hypothetical protein
MTLLREIPSGLAASAARLSDATTVLEEEQITAFVRERLDAHPFDGRSVRRTAPGHHGSPFGSCPHRARLAGASIERRRFRPPEHVQARSSCWVAGQGKHR